LLTKSYLYGKISGEKSSKAARLKMFECIDKNLSELVKKKQINRRPGFRVIYIDSKKHIFPGWHANAL
jgi:hypothetical protein